MTQKSLIDTQILKNIWNFIKQQARQFDTWFCFCGLVLLFWFVAIIMITIPIAIFSIGYVFLAAVILLKLGKILSVITFLCAVALCIALLSRVILWTFGFLNAIAVNALDAAYERPLRRFQRRITGFKYLMVPMVYSLIVCIGFCFFIIPGIVFAVRFSLARYAMLEQNCTIWQALMASWDMTQKHFWTLLALYTILLIMQIIPFAFLIELFFPISNLCMAKLYVQLQPRQLTQEIV